MRKKSVFSRLFLSILFLRLSKYLALLVLILILGKSGGLFSEDYSVNPAVILALVISAVFIRLIGRHLHENVTLGEMKSALIGEITSHQTIHDVRKIDGE